MMNSKSKSSNILTLGYDLDMWCDYGVKTPIVTDISAATNSHILLAGMSGSGKSYFENALFAKLAIANPDGEFYFADYKGDDSFFYLKEKKCQRYYFCKNALSALDIVYSRLPARQSGEDISRNPITLFFDEYMAYILDLTEEDKKAASVVKSHVSNILQLGRSLQVRFVTSLQRPDALAFPSGSRLNYGVVVVLGAAVRSIYEMLIPDFLEQVKGRQFGRGEEIIVLQGSELLFIKVPMVQDTERMHEICINGLTSNEKGNQI